MKLKKCKHALLIDKVCTDCGAKIMPLNEFKKLTSEQFPERPDGILEQRRKKVMENEAMAELELETRHGIKSGAAIAHDYNDLAFQAVGEAKKYDDGKPDMSLLSPIAITKIAEVMSFGRKKYAAHNWRAGFNWSRLIAAALRHILSYLGGEDKDPESGLSHLAHASCCLMFLLEFEVTHKDKDDRYKP
jgi:hypothetical protein